MNPIDAIQKALNTAPVMVDLTEGVLDTLLWVSEEAKTSMHGWIPTMSFLEKWGNCWLPPGAVEMNNSGQGRIVEAMRLTPAGHMIVDLHRKLRAKQDL